MPAGALLSAYAHEVAPRQKGRFLGGQVISSHELETALNSTFDRSKIAEAPAVSFEVDPAAGDRAHPIRDAVMTIAFTKGPHAGIVEGLAHRLAQSMDDRSKPTLLMISVHDFGLRNQRRVLIWTFPQQEVFNLHVGPGRSELELLEAFNRESSLRKVALIEGSNAKSGMLVARVLDFQATKERAVADLWIHGFLGARPQMNSLEGTRTLARVLRAAHAKTANDQDAQDQVLAAIAGLRVSRNPVQSLNQVEETYLTGIAAEVFRSCAGRQDLRSSLFPLDRDEFDRLIQYTRYELDNGAVVSAPFGALDAGVGAVRIWNDHDERYLRVEGRIKQEQVRKRA